MKKTIITTTLTFIIVTFVMSIFIINSNKILTSFNIVNVTNVSTNFNIKFEKSKAAEYYDLVLYNGNNIPIYTKQSENNLINTDFSMVEYDKKYKIVIYAYDKVGDSIAVNNPFTFKYLEPTFSKENDLILDNNKDYKLLILGDLTKKDYKIALYDNKYKIKEEKLNTKEYIIDKKYYQGLSQKLDVKILDGLNTISTISLYNNTSPVTDITITSPSNGNIIDYKDVILTYEGGNNATEFVVSIYNDDQLVKKTKVTKNRCIVSSEIFKKAEEYNITINANYKDYEEYSKSASVTFQMNEKSTLKPTYINKNPKYIKEGTNLIIENPNIDGTIYYTIDGTDPTTNGIEYTKPLKITKNLNLKTVIKEEKKNNSIISEYNLNIGAKETYSVYLSPSNQDRNIGVREVGFTNEMAEMNDLANYIEKNLKDNNIKVYRNSPYGNINLWTADSRYYGVDLHLAVHSNASTNHNQFGVETWINEEASKSYNLANLIQDSILSIYRTDEKGANRGVKYANGAFGEVNDLYVPFGILVEVAHHDNKEDAKWIMDNKPKIAKAISDAILDYFGIK